MKKFEIEQKYKIRNPAPVRRQLKKMGARLVVSGAEKNELWDFGNLLKKKNSVLRLREAGGKATLTFKGPRLKSKYKKRIETETSVNAQAMRLILKTLGYKIRVCYDKKREGYDLKNAHVTLDQLKGFGWFVEIEAEPEKIETLARKFGFTAKDREERSYLEMIYGNRSIWAGK